MAALARGRFAAILRRRFLQAPRLGRLALVNSFPDGNDRDDHAHDPWQAGPEGLDAEQQPENAGHQAEQPSGESEPIRPSWFIVRISKIGRRP